MAWLAAMRLLLMEETFAIWTQCNVCHLKLAIKDKHDRINSGPYGNVWSWNYVKVDIVPAAHISHMARCLFLSCNAATARHEHTAQTLDAVHLCCLRVAALWHAGLSGPSRGLNYALYNMPSPPLQAPCPLCTSPSAPIASRRTRTCAATNSTLRYAHAR